MEIAVRQLTQQGLMHPPNNMVNTSHKSSCASMELPQDQKYPVDDVQCQMPCEIHILIRNLTAKVAYGMASSSHTRTTYHDTKIPVGYLVVSVD